MPELSGRIALILTVTDVERSAGWYTDVFAMHVTSDYADPTGTTRSICLHEPVSGLDLCLRSGGGNRGTIFDHRNIGLDHAEFLVEAREDLDTWREHLDSLGIEHSGIKEPTYSSNAMLAFRDPDGIQLELFWYGSPRPST